jgi:hypothetical protein
VRYECPGGGERSRSRDEQATRHICDVERGADGIVHSSAMSYRAEPSGAVAERYGAAKIAKYRTIAEERDGQVLPFIIESSGGYGRYALNVLADVRRCASEHASMVSPKELVNWFLDAVAIGVQRGNALAVRRSVEMTQRDEYRHRVVSREHRTAATTATRTASLGELMVRSGVSIVRAVRRTLSLQ